MGLVGTVGDAVKVPLVARKVGIVIGPMEQFLLILGYASLLM